MEAVRVLIMAGLRQEFSRKWHSVVGWDQALSCGRMRCPIPATGLLLLHILGRTTQAQAPEPTRPGLLSYSGSIAARHQGRSNVGICQNSDENGCGEQYYARAG